MTPQEQYEHLVETVKGYNPAAGFDQIRAAYEFADTHHAGQNRKDGSPFITHPLAVAQIVAEELHLDTESIVAALLHDTIEDTTATHEELAKLFSPTVADLVEGVSKLTRVHYTSKEEEQMENLRKMLMAMAKDIRVILIKISDRLHNMRTMEYQTPEKQKQKSFETMEIYAPIAHRLGMQKMKWELEDLSLKYLDPVGYREITEALDEKAAEYDGFMSAVHDRIVTRLKEEGIDATVYGRMKHPYSIYRKMYTQNKSLDDVFDLFAFRVIVDTVADCYNVLGIIHDLFKPILGRFKDYIGTPKPNMYQSLHTTVVGESGIPFEVQIRTKEMHEVAEYGVAAHWKYKQNGQGAGDERSYEWVRRLLENQEDADAEDFIHSLKVDMFADEVFVFTPNGDVINLPAGATPIDFAYTIHSAIGNHMVGAKVNGRIVQFDYHLRNGDVVEGLTNCLVKFSKCCTPVPGDDIVGFITRGYGISVHRADCPNADPARRKPSEAGRWIKVSWGSDTRESYRTTLEITAKDRINIIMDVSTVLSSTKTHVSSMNARSTPDGFALLSLDIDVPDSEQLRTVMRRLEQISGVMRVTRPAG